jgi:hypothetical protein
VQELLGLLAHRGDHVGVAVTGRNGRDPGGEVEEAIAVDVLDRHAAAARHHERHVLAEILRHRAPVALDGGLRLRPGERSPEERDLDGVVGWKRPGGHLFLMQTPTRYPQHRIPPPRQGVKARARNTSDLLCCALGGGGMRRWMLVLALGLCGCGSAARPNVMLVVIDRARRSVSLGRLRPADRAHVSPRGARGTRSHAGLLAGALDSRPRRTTAAIRPCTAPTADRCASGQ